ncbi:acetylajmaline esterase [Ranunculus cassubicifolius]
MASNLSPSKTLALILFLFFSLSAALELNYPAVFNFGDSNSDTGGLVAGTALPLDPPYGQTYFHKPSGRLSDGRLIIDFLSKFCFPLNFKASRNKKAYICVLLAVEVMNLPFLSPYLESIGAPSFRKGCNFATAGSAILPDTVSYSPFTFSIQISQFIRFKTRVLELLSQGYKLNKYLPKEAYFRQGLYMFDIGQNDLFLAFRSTPEDQVLDAIPSFMSEFETGVKKLYDQGARKFWIHNTGPLGCLPTNIAEFGQDPSRIDEFGCVRTHNYAAKVFNLQLLTLCRKLQGQFSDTSVTYVDIFSIKLDLISNYSRYGFEQPGIEGIQGWRSKTANGTIVATKESEDSSKYISWDGVHYTEAANQHVSSQILTGNYSDEVAFSIRSTY